ncbi:hypothetical protein [Histidinibacterium lentulum]|uniref:Translocase n=1 Tax=Histidinibacterium lentulum TaxID=2480588 RepID=A0A3N2R6S1_9RHOB|nr:hypothetical protein [Histidinibacterium lentulum]ROU03071.1 hypothetical protein EAT49_07195 [Histidinibacterium lentulum]
MSRIRKIAMAGGTFGVALSIGFVMQNGDVMAARFGTDVPVIEGDDLGGPVSPPIETPPAMAGLAEDPNFVEPAEEEPAAGAPMEPEATAEAGADATADELPAIRFLSAPPSDRAPDAAAPDDAEVAPVAAGPGADAPASDEVPVPGNLAAGGLPDPFEIASLVTGLASRAGDLIPATPASMAATPQAEACATTMDAVAGRAAMVTLTLSAPCHPETQVTLHHQGMMFTLSTDASGRVEADVPALDTTAIFIASFANDGDGAVAAVEVPALANYDRAVLQWQGDASLQLHAREFGANYGDEGHVWLASARAEEQAIAGQGGFLTRLGDGSGPAPLFAEVYTFPSATVQRGGEVLLTVEAEITEASCGREVSAQSIQIRPGSAPSALDLVMTLPGCDAVGDFVVLNTMLEDLTLAAR